MKSFLSGIGNAVTSAYTSVKFGKDKAAGFQDLPAQIYEASANAVLPSPSHPFPFGELKGKVVLVVNIASMCGYTAGNNKWISSLAQKFADRKDFALLAFPCAQFGGQEHSEESKICSAHMDGLKDCKECWGKDLFLMEKVDVNGDDAHPIFKYLRLNSSLFDDKSGKVASIPWNYCKFLLDKEGNVKGFFKSGDTDNVEQAIENLLRD